MKNIYEEALKKNVKNIFNLRNKFIMDQFLSGDGSYFC